MKLFFKKGKDLPFSCRSSGGTCWQLLDPGWEACAQRAEDVLAGRDGAGAELIRQTRSRDVFRIRTGAGMEASIIIAKAFKLDRWNHRVFLSHRYGPREVRNLLHAARAGLPVPRVFGYGVKRRFMLVASMTILMEDLRPLRTAGELLELARNEPAKQAEILSRVTPLLISLHKAGCNHADFNKDAVFLDPRGAESPRVVDFQYARFLTQPSLNVLMFEAAFFRRSCAALVGQDVLAGWFETVLDSAEVADRQRWSAAHGKFLHRALHRKKRLRIR